MWELDDKESWAQKNWCFWTMVLEKTLESPLDCKEIQQVHPKGNQSWIFIGRTDAEAETLILQSPDVKSWLSWKTLMLGKIEGKRRRGRQRMRWLDGITDSMDMSLSILGELATTGRPGVLRSIESQRVGHDWWLNWYWYWYLNGLVIFATFFILRLNLAIRSSWSETQSAPGLVFASPSLAAKI